MQMLDQALLANVQAKEIDPDDAYVYASDKRLFQRFVTDTSVLPKLDLAAGCHEARSPHRRIGLVSARDRAARIDEYPEGSARARTARTCTSSPAIRRASACTASCTPLRHGAPRAAVREETLREIMPRGRADAPRRKARRRLRLHHSRRRRASASTSCGTCTAWAACAAPFRPRR